MNRRLFVQSLTSACLTAPAQTQQAPAPPKPPAIPVNYDEAQVGTYTLPDPLVLARS
jgi:hypothetical protein